MGPKCAKSSTSKSAGSSGEDLSADHAFEVATKPTRPNAEVEVKRGAVSLGWILIAVAVAILSIFLSKYEGFGKTAHKKMASVLKKGAGAEVRPEVKAKKAKTANVNDRILLNGEKWSIDPDPEFSEEATSISCDFEVLTAHGDIVKDSEGSIVNAEDYMDRPLVLKGFMDDWPAMQSNSGNKWQRNKLVEKHGKKYVVLDTEQMGAYSRGKTDTKFHGLAKALASFRKQPVGSLEGAQVVLDSTILRGVPALYDDVHMGQPIPNIFSSWLNEKAEQTDDAWLELHIGPSRAGLPFHANAGPSSLALLHGIKRWFVYPPGASQLPVQKEGSPLYSVFTWFSKVYPYLKSSGLPKPPQQRSVSMGEDSPGFTPLECVQRPGDIMYIPTGWSQQHMNIGESVAVGAQSLGNSNDIKLTNAKRVLTGSPNNVDALRTAGLSAAYLALEEDARVKYNMSGSTLNGMVRLHTADNSPDFRNIVLEGEDTWLVQYFEQGAEDTRLAARKLDLVALRLKGLVSVGGVEIPSRGTDRTRHDAVVRAHHLEQFFIPVSATDKSDKSGERGEDWDQTPKTRFSAPVRVFPGNRHRGLSLDQAIAGSQLFEYKTDKTSKTGSSGSSGGGSDSSGDSDVAVTAEIEATVDFSIDFLSNSKLQEGSATVVGAKAKRLFTESLQYLKRNKELQTWNPEAHVLLAEVFGHASLFDSMKDSIQSSVQTFDTIASKLLAASFQGSSPNRNPLDVGNTVSKRVLAGVFHRLAEVLLGHEEGKDAEKLLEKSLALQPDYAPALLDAAVAQLLQKNKPSVEKALERAEAGGIKSNHPKFRKIREYLESVSQDIEQAGFKTKGKRSRGQPKSPPKGQRREKMGEGEAAASVKTKKAAANVKVDLDVDAKRSVKEELDNKVEEEERSGEERMKTKKGKMGEKEKKKQKQQQQKPTTHKSEREAKHDAPRPEEWPEGDVKVIPKKLSREEAEAQARESFDASLTKEEYEESGGRSGGQEQDKSK